MFPRLLALILPAAALLAAPAASPAMSIDVGGWDYLEIVGSDIPETVTIEPGTSSLTFTSPQGITVHQTADALCGPNGQTVTCSTTGIHGLGAVTYGGADSITLNLPQPGEVDFDFDVFGGEGADTIIGGAGDDDLVGDGGGDTINGRGGSDSISGSAGTDTIFGETGDDRLFGGEDADWISGADGYDDLEGGAGNDTLSGGADGDDIEPGPGNDGAVDGGPDLDTIRYDDGRYTPVAVDLTTTAGSDGDAGEDAVNMEHVVGGNGPDTITGTTGGNKLEGRGGNDTIVGGAGGDTVSGDGGDDTLQGGIGTDQLYGGGEADTLDGGTEHDSENGGAGNDTFVADPGADNITGGDGVDAADYSARTMPVNVSLAEDGAAKDDGGTADDADGVGPLTDRDQLHQVEVAYGSTQADTMVVLAYGGELHGGAGDDTLTGGTGKDRLFGDAGADKLVDAKGEDELSGGTENDTFVVKDFAKDAIDCGSGDADVVSERDVMDLLTGCERDVFGEAVAKDEAEKAAAKQAAIDKAAAEKAAAIAAAEARRQAAIAADEARRRAATTPPPVVRTGSSSVPPVAGGLSVWKFARSGKKGAAKVTSLKLSGLSPAARVTLTCEPRSRGACPLKRSKPLAATARGTLDLTKLLKGRALPARTSLLVEITEPGKLGRAMRWTVRGGSARYSEFTFTRSL